MNVIFNEIEKQLSGSGLECTIIRDAPILDHGSAFTIENSHGYDHTFVMLRGSNLMLKHYHYIKVEKGTIDFTVINNDWEIGDPDFSIEKVVAKIRELYERTI